LEDVGGADLRSEKVYARVRVGLAAIGKMLVEDPGIKFEMVVHLVGNAGRRQDVEGEVLSLRAEIIRMAVEPAKTDSARNVGNKTRPRLGEVVTKPDRDAVIEILRPADDRFDHKKRVNLVVTLEPAVALDDAPAPARGEELSSDFVAVGVADDP